MEWISLSQDRTIVNTVMNLRVALHRGISSLAEELLVS